MIFSHIDNRRYRPRCSCIFRCCQVQIICRPYLKRRISFKQIRIYIFPFNIKISVNCITFYDCVIRIFNHICRIRFFLIILFQMICIVSFILTIIYPTILPFPCVCQKNISVLIMTFTCDRYMTRAIQRISCRKKVCNHVHLFSVRCHGRIDKRCRIVIMRVPVITKVISKRIVPCLSFVCRTGYDRIQSTTV